jgi:hypothetical protein
MFMKGSGMTLTEEVLAIVLFKPEEVEMLMPLNVRDFTDFSSSKNHA